MWKYLWFLLVTKGYMRQRNIRDTKTKQLAKSNLWEMVYFSQFLQHIPREKERERNCGRRDEKKMRYVNQLQWMSLIRFNPPPKKSSLKEKKVLRQNLTTDGEFDDMKEFLWKRDKLLCLCSAKEPLSVRDAFWIIDEGKTRNLGFASINQGTGKGSRVGSGERVPGGLFFCSRYFCTRVSFL